MSDELATIGTLAELLAWRVARTPQAEAYRHYEEAGARWASLSWKEAGALVARFTAALGAVGLPAGARVAILLPNGVAAVGIDQAALALGCVPVPMHALDNPASIAYIVADSEAGLLLATSDSQWQAILDTGIAMPALRQVVVLERERPPSSLAATPPVLGLAQWLARGESAATPTARHPPAATDLAALVYTSGTTGKPKGVMLTHDNVMSNVRSVLERVAPTTADRFLSFLPLSHTFERTAGYYLAIAAGACVAFSRSTKLLAEDLKIVQPTILISVPRIYERVFAGAESRLSGSPLRLYLLRLAQSVGWRRFCRRQGLPAARGLSVLLDAALWPALDRLVGTTLRAQFGGRLRIAVSGGAPLSAPVARCFLGLGVPIAQGYGMTETSPVVSANTPDDNDPSTVGRALPGVEVRIGENRELLVRGPNVMRGYWKREEDTAHAFADGWLRTGDQAAIEGGRIRIIGRVKEIIVTATGEKIAPADLELAITADSAFEGAYAFGDNRPFIACIVVLAAAYWRRLAGELALDAADPMSLAAAPARAAVLERIRGLTASFPHYAQPRGVALTLEPWTVENSLMTPTLKLKRHNLAARFAAEIEAIYRR